MYIITVNLSNLEKFQQRRKHIMKKIIIASYQENFLTAVSEMLDSYKNVTIGKKVSNGDELLGVVKENSPDIILCDLLMPYIDGLGAISIIKKDREIKNKPYSILASPVKTDTMVKEAYSVGVDYYLIKPFNRNMLYNVLDQGISLSEEDFQKPIIRSEDDIKNEVTKVLKNLGIPPIMKGYSCLREAIYLCTKDPSNLTGVTKHLYPELQKMYNCNTERAMRYAIETAFNKANDGDYIRKIFGSLPSDMDRPTVTQFIASVSDIIRLESGYKK